MLPDLGLLALVALGVIVIGHGAQKAFGAFGGRGSAADATDETCGAHRRTQASMIESGDGARGRTGCPYP